MGWAFLILTSPSHISALGFVEKRELCLLFVCPNSSLSRELAAAQDPSQLWCPHSPSYGLSFNANEELLTCIVFQRKERKFRKGSTVLEFEEPRHFVHALFLSNTSVNTRNFEELYFPLQIFSPEKKGTQYKIAIKGAMTKLVWNCQITASVYRHTCKIKPPENAVEGAEHYFFPIYNWLSF